MRSFYTNKSVDLSKTLSEKIDSENLDETEIQKLTEKQKLIGRKIINIIQHLNKTTDKKNIMIEAKELFYDGDFMEKLDTNPYLLCFNNYIRQFFQISKTLNRNLPMSQRRGLGHSGAFASDSPRQVSMKLSIFSSFVPTATPFINLTI